LDGAVVHVLHGRALRELGSLGIVEDVLLESMELALQDGRSLVRLFLGQDIDAGANNDPLLVAEDTVELVAVIAERARNRDVHERIVTRARAWVELDVRPHDAVGASRPE